MDRGGLPGAHEPDLSFLEVGFEIDVLHGDDGHQPRAWLRVLAHTYGAVTDTTSQRTADNGVLHIELRLAQARLRGLELRAGLIYLRLGCRGLTLSCLECSDVGGHGCGGLTARVAEVGQAFVGFGARGDQGLVTLYFLDRMRFARAGAFQLRLGLRDAGLLLE